MFDPKQTRKDGGTIKFEVYNNIRIGKIGESNGDRHGATSNWDSEACWEGNSNWNTSYYDSIRAQYIIDGRNSCLFFDNIKSIRCWNDILFNTYLECTLRAS